MIGPVGQREMDKSQLTLVFPLLRIIAMPVVDGGDSTLDMVKNLRDNQTGDSHRSHEARGRPAQTEATHSLDFIRTPSVPSVA